MNNEELCNAVEFFNVDEYRLRLNAFFDKIGVFEKGTASQSVVDYIIDNT